MATASTAWWGLVVSLGLGASAGLAAPPPPHPPDCGAIDVDAACTSGDVEACAKQIPNVRYTKKDYPRAYCMMKALCDRDHFASCFDVAGDLAVGRDVAADPDAARALLDRACRGRHGAACLRLAEGLRVAAMGPTATGADRDAYYGRLLEGCVVGHVESCNYLAMGHRHGQLSLGLDTRATAALRALGAAAKGSADIRKALAHRDHIAGDVAACKKGDAELCYVVGSRYASGTDVPKDLALAKALLDRGCGKGDAMSCAAALDVALESGAPAREVTTRARKILAIAQKACGKPDPTLEAYDGHDEDGDDVRTLEPCVLGAHVLREGLAGAPDPLGALALLERGCGGASKEGCKPLGHLLIGGTLDAATTERVRGRLSEVCRRDGAPFSVCRTLARYPEAVDHRRACEAGDLDRCADLGAVLRDSGMQDVSHALFEATCSRGAHRCCAEAATLKAYRESRGTGASGAAAALVALVEAGCEAANPRACHALAGLSRWGRGGVPRDEALAVQRLERALAGYRGACAEGDGRACREAALLKVAPGPVDPALATPLLTRGCELGDGGACRGLGELQGAKRGEVAGDRRAALASYGRGCRLGDAEACARLYYRKSDEAAPEPERTAADEALSEACRAGVAAGCSPER